jgi:hypothetical protein
MPSLQVNLKKISADQSSFHCRRPDGTDVWSRVHPFYPHHDLSHFAVESALGLRQGFYGLIADGWDLSDFLEQGAATRLPVEAFWTECVVGVTELLNRNAPLPLGEWQDALDQSVAGQKLAPFRRVGADEYARMNSLRFALLARWTALPTGETLALEFALPA